MTLGNGYGSENKIVPAKTGNLIWSTMELLTRFGICQLFVTNTMKFNI